MRFDNILCVCTGNICRSPLAEAYLASRLDGINITSAGTHALVGHAVDETARAVGQARELSLDSHEARQLTLELAKGQDLILVMEQGHLDWIASNIPTARGCTFLVSQWRDRADVDDPYRRSREYFETIFSRLALCLDDWVTSVQSA